MTETVEVVVRADVAQFTARMQESVQSVEALQRQGSRAPASVNRAFDARGVRDFNRDLVKANREFEKLNRSPRARAGRAGVAGGVAGAVAGFAVGSVASSGPVSNLTGLAMNVILASLLPVFQALLPALEVLSGALAPVGSVLGPAVDKFAREVAPLLAQFIQTVGPPILALAGSIAKLGAELLTKLAPSIAAITTAAGSILESLSPVIKKIIDVVGPIIEKLAPAVAELVAALAPVASALVDIVGPVLTVAAEVFSKVIRIVARLVKKVFGEDDSPPLPVPQNVDQARTRLIEHATTSTSTMSSFDLFSQVPGVKPFDVNASYWDADVGISQIGGTRRQLGGLLP